MDLEDLVESRSPVARDRRIIRPNLVESEEYEWTSPLNLPGLIVAAPAENRWPVVRQSPARPQAPGEVVETEDGDAISACQLPGGLLAGSAPVMLADSSPPLPSELEWMDEYAERAAMQLPGQLVQSPVEELPEAGAPRQLGLCTTCAHHQDCDFPRPESGVWRCEEYA